MGKSHLHLVMLVMAVLMLGSLAGAGEGFVPVVAQSRGSGGSFWSTELWISNPTSRRGSYGVVFLPAGHDNTRLLSTEPDTQEIKAGATIHLNDVVPPDSIGALRVITSEGLIVRCRVFNTRGRGSAGQMVPLLTVDQMIRSNGTGVLVPLLRDGQVRTNIGVFNPSPNAVAVRIELRNEAGERVGETRYNVEAGSLLQLNDALLGFRVRHCARCQALIRASGPVAAYSSVVDNRSGAATFILPAIR